MSSPRKSRLLLGARALQRQAAPEHARPGRRRVLADEWKAWAIENFLQGAVPVELVSALVEHGVPRAVAAREIAELNESAAMRACRALHERNRQLTQRSNVLTELRKAAREVERVTTLSESEFFSRYYATNTPVVFTELLRDWPALQRWTPEFLRDHYGKVDVEIVEGRADDPYCDRKHDAVKRTTTMAEYAERVINAGKTNDFYFTARNRNIELEGLRGLNADVRCAPELFLPEPLKGSQSFWFGPEGSLTATHHDPTNILFCQIYGSKHVQLVPPTDAGLLREAEGYYNRSILDLHSYDQLSGSHILDIMLAPGEALFIPALWWHRVEALSVSISFSLLHFKHTNRYPDYRA